MQSHPASHLAMLELPRAAAEMAMIPPAMPLLFSMPRGDGHPVLVIPGFLGRDIHTSVIRQYLRIQGYKTFGWSLGRNLGIYKAGGLDALMARLDEVQDASGARKVSLIGWSLGGVFARRMAEAAPHKVRQVISLGSPIGNENYLPTSVPSTAIYSRSDGVVPPHFAQEPETATTENIEVLSSHSGLVFNPHVLYLLSQKLSMPESEWKKSQRPF